MDEPTGLPGVSTVIPTHNRPDLMLRAVRSVLTQEYDGPVEVIVVFDAETPYVPEVEIPAGRTLKVMANDRVRGLAGARNSGILASSLEYVAFLDDDDFWFPGKLAAQMPHFADDAPPVLVCTAMVYDDGEKTHERLVPKEHLDYADLVRDRMAGIPSGSFVARRDELTGRLGLVDEDLPGSYGEDYDMLLRAASIAPVAVVNRPLVSVTWAQNSYYMGKWGLYADGLQYLFEKHPGFAADRKACGRITSQIAFARAANGERRTALRWSRRALRNDVTQVKAWLAVAVSVRLMSAPWVVRTVQKMGRGI